MPAPSKFTFTSGAYIAQFEGLITSELALSLIGRTRIRAYGTLKFTDNEKNIGRLTLQRSGIITINLNAQAAIHHSIPKITWLNTPIPTPQPA